MKETMEALESFGINMDSGEMRVLQSLLRAGLGSERPTFDRIYSIIKESKGRVPKRAWVYRCLDNLEADGFISVDKLQRPRLYSASRLTIVSGLNRARRNRIAALQDDLCLVTQTMQLLDYASPIAMSAYVYEALTGGGRQPATGVVRGVDNVRKLIRTEILDKAVPGDTMRLTHRLDNLAGIKDTMSVIDEEILSVILRGVDMHVVLIPSALASDMSTVSQVMLGHQTQIMDALKSRHLVFRMYPHDIQTYRLLALNNEKLMMILTHAWRPDTVVLFKRDEHPVLVDNAIQTFDRLWDESVDTAQLLAARLQKLAEPGG